MAFLKSQLHEIEAGLFILVVHISRGSLSLDTRDAVSAVGNGGETFLRGLRSERGRGSSCVTQCALPKT